MVPTSAGSGPRAPMRGAPSEVALRDKARGPSLPALEQTFHLHPAFSPTEHVLQLVIGSRHGSRGGGFDLRGLTEPAARPQFASSHFGLWWAAGDHADCPDRRLALTVLTSLQPPSPHRPSRLDGRYQAGCGSLWNLCPAPPMSYRRQSLGRSDVPIGCHACDGPAEDSEVLRTPPR
jgi:hypothetical protein